MWYTIFRQIFNLFIFLVYIFERFLDLESKWNIFVFLLSTCFFMEWCYGLAGENRLDYFLSLMTAWFPLWLFLVTEFILLKPLPLSFHLAYPIIVMFVYIIFAYTKNSIMCVLFYIFWLYYYIAVLTYLCFMFSLIILLTEHFKLIQRFFAKLKIFFLKLAFFGYIIILSFLILCYFLIYSYIYIIYLYIYTIYLFIKYLRV